LDKKTYENILFSNDDIDINDSNQKLSPREASIALINKEKLAFANINDVQEIDNYQI
jgi:hypothetical protein